MLGPFRVGNKQDLMTKEPYEGAILSDIAEVVRAYTPRGSKYPISDVSGSKNHTLGGFGDQKP